MNNNEFCAVVALEGLEMWQSHELRIVERFAYALEAYDVQAFSVSEPEYVEADYELPAHWRIEAIGVPDA